MEICFSNLATTGQYIKSFIIITVFQNWTDRWKIWRLDFPTVNHHYCHCPLSEHNCILKRLILVLCPSSIKAYTSEKQRTSLLALVGVGNRIVLLAVKQFYTHLSRFKTCECLRRDPLIYPQKDIWWMKNRECYSRKWVRLLKNQLLDRTWQVSMEYYMEFESKRRGISQQLALKSGFVLGAPDDSRLYGPQKK